MIRSRLGWLLLCGLSVFFVAVADLGILRLEARGQSQESFVRNLDPVSSRRKRLSLLSKQLADRLAEGYRSGDG